MKQTVTTEKLKDINHFKDWIFFFFFINNKPAQVYSQN